MGRTQFRDGDTMIAVETAPATISFKDILAATQVFADNDETMTPWEHCDGFEHECIEHPGSMEHVDNPREMQGWGRAWDSGASFVIVLDKDEDYGIYKYMRKRGASKMVAREAVALERRRTLAQLVKWYENGWTWYGVKCEMTVLDDVYEASVYGIDDDEYARREVAGEIASEVAGQLERDGYTITDKPEEQHPRPWEAKSREQKQAMLGRRLMEQSWAGNHSRK